MRPVSRNIAFLSLIIAAAAAFIANISLGPVQIPAWDVFSVFTGGDASKPSWTYIIQNYRIPKAIAALLAGAGLSISGLLMQTLFRNPLAGPYVLGLSSGSSLGVAFSIMGAGLLPSALSSVLTAPGGIILASCLGSLMVLLAVMAVSARMRETMSILIVGLMFGSFTAAIVGVLTYFAPAEDLQRFTFWSLGNLGNLAWESVAILSLAVIVGLLLAIRCIKPLDSLLLGERYAASIGMDIRLARWAIILSTSILAGSITAFVGPIAFIGLAVPHMARLLFGTASHRVLFPATVLLGAIVLLFCDTMTQFPGTDILLPINAITSLIGAPIVIWLLVKKPQT